MRSNSIYLRFALLSVAALVIATLVLIDPHAVRAQTSPPAQSTPKPCAAPVTAVAVKLGLGFRPAKADCAVAFSLKLPGTGMPAEKAKVTMFGDTPASLKMTYTLVAPAKAADSLAVEIYADASQSTPVTAVPLATYTVTPFGTCEASIGSCAVKEATFVRSGGDGVWSGTMTADIGNTALFAQTGHVARYLRLHLLRGAVRQPLDRDDPVRLTVAYDASSDGYGPKPNADTNKIRDGISAFMRSRLGFDAVQNWTPILRASAGVGQSATDQSAKAKRVGDDLLKGNDNAGAAKDGFTVTDADVFTFLDLSNSGARLSSARGRDAVQKDLSDSGAAVTPFALRNIIAPDGAVKVVLRNDGGPGAAWRILGGALFDAAAGDDPASVADGAAVVTARRAAQGRTSSLSAMYSFTNRTQTSIDFVNGPFVRVPLQGGVTAAFPVPSPRPVHVVNEGIQFADDRDNGLSTFFRATAEPSRVGSDVFGALRWSGQKSWNPGGPLFMTTARYAAVAGWRATANDFIAPLGTRVDLSGTRGPFYVLSGGVSRAGPDLNRESALTFYQSRWSSLAGLEQYTSRLDGQYDFANRLGFTGSGTLSAATLELLTRESTHIALPLTAGRLVPVRQGNAGLSWRPPNGEFTLQRGFAFLTDCENVASTNLAPKGLPKGTVVPACFPIGRATFTGSGRITAGNLSALVSYGAPTAVDRTPLLGGAIQRAAAIRYTFGCDMLQAAYINRAGYDAYTDSAGSTYGVTLELHNLIHLPLDKRVNLTLTYAGSTKIPLGAPAQSKSAFDPSPDFFHTPDAKGC